MISLFQQKWENTSKEKAFTANERCGKLTEEGYQAVARRMLTPDRYHHSLCVAKQARYLAQRYECQENDAYLAGLLHDICKDMPTDAQLQTILKSDIILSGVILSQPAVWHGLAASVFIQTELNIKKTQIIDAIRYHTTGRANMTLLDRVLYLADLTSEDRDYPDVDNMRKLADISLDRAMKEALKFIVADLAHRNQPIVEDTWEAYNEYIVLSDDTTETRRDERRDVI